jgi:hypothetical protein
MRPNERPIIERAVQHVTNQAANANANANAIAIDEAMAPASMIRRLKVHVNGEPEESVEERSDDQVEARRRNAHAYVPGAVGHRV